MSESKPSARQITPQFSSRIVWEGVAVRTGRYTLRVILLGILSFSCVRFAVCQPEPARPIATERDSTITPTSTMREGLIHLDVTVIDRAGDPVSGLTANEFTLLDSGMATKLLSFRASEQARDDSERLTEMVLVLDEVNLSPTQLAIAQRETVKFLEQSGGRLARPVSVYWFTMTGLYATARPSNDGIALAKDVVHHHSPRILWEIPPIPEPYTEPRRQLWSKSLQALYSIAVERRDRPGRKLVVWIGFGWPVSSGNSRFEHVETPFSAIVELSTRIREARLALYQITGWVDSGSFNFPDTKFIAGIHSKSELEKSHEQYAPFALSVLTIQSGGLVLDSAPDIPRALEKCVRNTSTFYTVSFDPPHAEHPDEYHDLKMQLGMPGSSARTNSGYYDQPVFYDQPQVARSQVSVRELGKILAAPGSQNEEKLAEQLKGFELTERLRSSLLSVWEDRLRDKKSKAALLRLADESAFLNPPADEIVSDIAPDPDPDRQRDMLSRTAKYVDEVLLKLPDFFATRNTIEFEQWPPKETDDWKTALADQSLHEAVTEKATIQYRNGHEERDAEKKTGSHNAKLNDLSFAGIFGPVLSSALADTARTGSTITWSHWERGEQGQEAVFHYSVQGASPSYAVVQCCLRGGTAFRPMPEHHGELTIDPETGAVLRLTMESEPGWILEPDLQPVRPVTATRMMVEYGPVEIGGRKYICPDRSVVMVRGRAVRPIVFWNQRFEIYAPYETLLNDIAFTDYHKFGSESRILPGFEVAPN